MELGYRGSGEVLKREEFEARKLAAEANKQTKKINSSKLYFLFFNRIHSFKQKFEFS